LKVLLDHNLDRRLKNFLTKHFATTAQELGWANVSNGRLLALAEENGFDVLLTADVKMKIQQDISQRKIAILILRAFDNRLKTHVEMIGEVDNALTVIGSGRVVEIFHSKLKTKSD
jgi:predicted nuclease of predicted toxin-antitoxin system